MPTKWIGPWPGGRIMMTSKGPAWVLERMIEGHRFIKKLHVKDQDAAMAELALWTRDPEGYGRHEPKNALCLTEASIGELLDYLKVTGGNTRSRIRYTNNLLTYLAEWQEFFDGRDIRRFRLSDLNRFLQNKKTAIRWRVTALKDWTRYLRREGRLDKKEDPTLDLT